MKLHKPKKILLRYNLKSFFLIDCFMFLAIDLLYIQCCILLCCTVRYPSWLDVIPGNLFFCIKLSYVSFNRLGKMLFANAKCNLMQYLNTSGMVYPSHFQF